MSFTDLQDYLQLQTEITGEDLFCSHRTFQRDIQRIDTLFNIEIEYNSTTKKYEITYDGHEEHNERLMEAYDVYNALNVSDHLSQHVIVEKRKPLGTENLHGLLHAIRNYFSVSFMYEKFSDGDLRQRTVKPVAIKEAQNRWYLLAEDSTDTVVKSFGLDRISELEISTQKFSPVEYDAEKEYRHSFGVINGVDTPPEKIVLSFTPKEGKYINSLPLHKSQTEVLKNNKEWRFAYFLRPTHDFIMEVLSYGVDVKVVEPESFKNTVLKHLREAIEQY
ncbi:helix-turn-helix transcriptional regulator [Salinimicrobium soli]|uniref:helix-turn-helix transcriptional regulator n=1 Tax=Salinimicrobium soli TaxID=1254399 RepID=UPI003AAE3281